MTSVIDNSGKVSEYICDRFGIEMILIALVVCFTISTIVLSVLLCVQHRKIKELEESVQYYENYISSLEQISDISEIIGDDEDIFSFRSHFLKMNTKAQSTVIDFMKAKNPQIKDNEINLKGVQIEI